jgi:hypothetical protein
MSKEVTKTYDVSEIKQGYFICWNVCTQCWNACSVKLTDDKGNQYFTYNKPFDRSGNLKFLGQGSADCRGNKLILVVTCTTDTGEIKQSINSYNITDGSAATIGHGYNLCIEDSSDEDYNDVYIDLVAWKKKG